MLLLCLSEWQAARQRFRRAVAAVVLPITTGVATRTKTTFTGHAAVPKPHPKNSANNYADKIKNNFSFYTARHSWATAARNHQVPVSVISAGMGHTSERTTQIYLTMLENSLIDNANKRILESLRCIVSLQE